MKAHFFGLLAAASSGATIVALVSSGVAYAQSSGTYGDAPVRNAEGAEQGGDIVVTARLRAERLQDIPVAATAFTTADITRYNTDSLQQMAMRTPTLTIGALGNPMGGVINLRGIGSPTSSPLVDQAVSVNIDGIQVSQANILRMGFYDLDRIEILKGPQTLFYGKNSPGGIISIISGGPGDHLEGKLRAGYETEYHRRFVEATISSPLTPTLGVRLTGYFGKQRGWYRNIAEPQGAFTAPPSVGGGTTAPNVPNQRYGPASTNYFVRGTLAYRAESEILDAALKFAYGRQDGENGSTHSTQYINCPAGRPQFAVALGLNFSDCKLDRNVAEGKVPSRIQALNPLFGDGDLHDRQRQLLTSLTANLNPTDDVTITSVSGYYNIRADVMGNYSFNGLNYVPSRMLLDQKQYSQELRALTSFSSPLNFMVGAYYQHVRNYSRNISAFDTPVSAGFSGGLFNGPFVPANNRVVQLTNAYSFYGQGILDISSQLQLTAGGRYSHERKRVSAVSYPNSFTPDTFVPTITPDRRSFKDFSPDITLTYKPLPTLTLYAAAREGFLSGGFDVNGATPGFGRRAIGDTSYRQETVRGGEIGAKGSLFNRQVSFDAVIFHYKYRDLQLSAFDSITGSFRLTNAGAAIVKGAELNVQLRPSELPGFTGRSSLAYVPTRYGSFRNAPCYVGQTPAAGCNLLASRDASQNLVVAPITGSQVGNAQDLTGRPILRNSDWSLNFGGTYEQGVGNGLTASLSADANYVSGFFASTAEEPASRQRRAWRLNANFALRGNDDRWELTVIGTNLTKTLRVPHSFVAAGTGGNTGRPTGFAGDEVGVADAPRTMTLQVTFRY